MTGGWKKLIERTDVRTAAGLALVVVAAIAQHQSRERESSASPAGGSVTPPSSPSERHREQRAVPLPARNSIPSPSVRGYDPVNAAFQSSIQLHRFMNNLSQKGPWQPIG